MSANQKPKPARAARVRKKTNKAMELPTMRANSAGIDIGAEEIWVAIPADRDQEPVRRFGSFTAELKQIADWLKACKIETVAMESTGVYWIPLFQILSDHGFEVCLVNARHLQERRGTAD